jgi:lipoic acid synthetase
VDLQHEAEEIGFLGVMSGPLVRSSYRAGRLWATAMRKKGWDIPEALRDLHAAGCDLITITQYLRPSERHLPVDRWVKPQEFVDLQHEAEEIGFLGVMSGPLVRSSYRAGRLWATAMRKKGWEIPAALAHIESSGTTRQEASTILAAHA